MLGQRSEDMLRFIGEQFATATFSPAVGQIFGWIVGIVFCLLLLSAANTAIVAMIGLLYMMSRDGEMPRQFRRLNRHGVPMWPLFIAIGLPVIVLLFAANFTALAGLYAIGVVGAITVNVGSCTFNRTKGFTWYDHVLFGITFVILAFVELTLAHTKLDALQFVLAVLIGGLALRAYTQKLQGLTTLTVTREVAKMVTPDLAANHATAFAGRSKNHGRSARNYPGAQLCDGRSAVTQSHALCALRERGRRLLTQQPAHRLAAPNGRTIPKQTPSCARCSNSGASVAST